ncbi:MAG: hypothetical protein ACRENC_19075, partial [Gemmatimonadaceae bacterium]
MNTMVFLGHLWLPILLSPVVVFFASFLLHMVLTYHRSDYRGLSNEEGVRAAINAGRAGPGQYMMPYCANPKEMQSPEMKQKFAEGPVAVLTIRASGQVKMGPMLGGWFIYLLVISFFTAYVLSRTMPLGTPYLVVFRTAGTVAWMGYAGAEVANSIWRAQPWAVTW